ncbi:MAG TPA: xanthine dehydrogenase family protein, partial [Methylomirabilota bacterium]|nr:xanthine dehydrogenase family protein [Methylomirabilota bacterium]
MGFSVIGKGTPKRDGAEKVTGHTQFLHDVTLPRMAHGAILRTQYPHARVLRIDTSAAEALPGVLAVITADRVEQHPVGFAKDHLALKGGAADGGKVRCIRDEIAAVAALTEEIAQEATRLIQVDYEELPAVFDPDSALRPGAPLIHDELGSNLVNLKYQFSHGDVEAAFAQAHVVVEGSYRLNYVTTACLGTMVAIASWSAPGSPDNSLTMWSTTQVPFLYQRDLAEALGITGDRVRVIQPPVGGNFGRGLDLYPIDIIAALLARRAGRPVKIAFERIEEFIASPTREPCVIHLRTAADRDGRLLARDARVVIDNGAYVSWGSTTPYVMLATTAGLYRVPAVRFDTTIVYTNNPYSGSMRGYGNLESTFAIEAQMDDLAERLGLDRMEIRRRNATRAGDVNPQGSVITSCGMTECLDAVEREMRTPVARPPRPGWKRGVGFAAMFHVGGGARVYRSDGCGAILKLDDFGKVSLITGASEIGQGSETVLAMIVAEEL